MTDKTDALVALDIAIAHAAQSRVSLHLTRAKQLREALAAQPAASVDVDALRTIIGDGIGGIRAEALTICNVTDGLAQKCSDRIVDRCDKVSKKLQALIDSAGGAKVNEPFGNSEQLRQALQDEIDRLRPDAERYRWVKSQGLLKVAPITSPPRIESRIYGDYTYRVTGAFGELDMAIDAAMNGANTSS